MQLNNSFDSKRSKKGKNMTSPSYNSIVQCSIQTGIPGQEIRRAKRSGQCPSAFIQHRVILIPLIRWLYGAGRKKTDRHIVDVDAAKEKDLLASAALKEQKKKVNDGLLVPEEYVSRALRETLLPVRQRLFAMPSEIAHLANPADPAHARKVLNDWLEINLPAMQAGTLPGECPLCGQKQKPCKKD
jgi:hypothetical protein